MNLNVGCPDGTPDYAEPVPDPDLDWTWPAADTVTDDSIAGCPDGAQDYAEPPVPDPDLDWTWPAADTFTDDSIARRTLHTCSELGSQRIRLIRIRPGSPRDTIECDTKVCFLSEAGEYIALSYTWGIPVERCQIIVDNQPRLVTVNLERFLYQARKLPRQFFGWLWIDALSIQQSDPWEKLEQVKLLSTIFAGATGAVVWLGPAYGNSDLAMKSLATQKTRSSRWKTRRSVWASPISSAIVELCNRPYWSRLWVFQELKASRTTAILCGSRCVHLDLLESLIYDYHDDRVEEKVQTLLSSSAGMMLDLIRESMDMSLRDMLDETGHLRCTDPRDKVYAILNVVTSGCQGIEADYTNTLPKLMNQILRNMHATQRPQHVLEMSLQCSLLEDLLGTSRGSIFGIQGNPLAGCPDALEWLRHTHARRPPTDELVRILKDLRAWCEHYGHQMVAGMIRRDLRYRWNLEEQDLELAEWRRDMLLETGSENDLETIKLCGELGKILKSFESICRGVW